jgi:heme-degrading monooxygenase HmoA
VTHRMSITVNNANYAAILALWGNERAWKDWVKAQTFAEFAPPPPPMFDDIYASTFVD